jgi:THAP domain
MEFWIKFTQQKSNFQPKGSSTICEDHFAKDSFQKKKDRVCLSKDAVPTIILRQTSSGVEKIEINFDAENRCYNENDFSLLSAIFKGNSVDEESVVRRKQQKLEEFKSVCRFCFCNDVKEEFNCIPINKLETYSIDINEFIKMLGMEANNTDIFSDILCEQCFQQIVEIDAFRKKCTEAQHEMLSEIQEIDEELSKIQSTKSLIVKDEIDVTYEVLEEHLIEETDEFYEDAQFVVQEVEQITSSDGVDYIEELNDDFKIIYDSKHVDHELIASEQTIETEDVVDFDEFDDDKGKSHGIDEYEVVSTDDIIKNPERNRFCFRIYECFFCKMVS